jgi:ferredoxin
MARVRVDDAICTGHGRCYALAPEVFDADGAGHCRVVTPELPASLHAKALTAAANCPESAIVVEE